MNLTNAKEGGNAKAAKRYGARNPGRKRTIIEKYVAMPVGLPTTPKGILRKGYVAPNALYV